MQIDVYHHFSFGDPTLKLILAGIVGLEKHMSKQDEAIDAAVAEFDGKTAALGASLAKNAAALANIAADEKNILAQLKDIPSSDLTPENQAKLDGAIARLGVAADNSAAQATTAQDLADSIPDVPQPPAA